ncbi:hypothetical protein, partial [Photobacterium leiognathi]|uniref:hypothetical protein n=1 Tax=Photobacterium leiognathi TaxID=553611 RepID=UPI001F1E61D9
SLGYKYNFLIIALLDLHFHGLMARNIMVHHLGHTVKKVITTNMTVIDIIESMKINMMIIMNLGMKNTICLK